ncbi:MAG TPA: enoyl-CoA hydratase-related protein [Thermoanaerobaculia bacterium]|nr:enoyl-CoA hydratase-related protein [Thermoanaerobaculia bacterium]
MTHILTSIDDAVGTITLDRRERFNSLDVETARDLRKAGLQMARDASVRAVVLRGAGGVFCSGADLKDIRNAPSYGNAFQEILEYIHSTISEIRRAPKPFIAAVDGIAAAGGFGLAMSCDLVIASDRAAFEWAYAKTGLTGAESSTFMLPRLIGLRRALELLLLNPRLDAARALDYGLINAVVTGAMFDAEVQKIARQLAAGPTEALGVAKELLNQAAGMDRLDVHLDRELEQLARIANGENFAEGIGAFFEKRAPKFGAA